MKIQTTIRATKDTPKPYLLNLFKDVAEFAKTLPQYKEAELAFFGKEDARGGFNISFYRKNGLGMTHFAVFANTKELISFCEGIRTAKRGF